MVRGFLTFFGFPFTILISGSLSSLSAGGHWNVYFEDGSGSGCVIGSLFSLVSDRIVRAQEFDTEHGWV